MSPRNGASYNMPLTKRAKCKVLDFPNHHSDQNLILESKRIRTKNEADKHMICPNSSI